MRILAVDTSTSTCRSGIFDSEIGTIADISVNLGVLNQRRHSEYLINLIDTILTKSGYSLDDIDLFAVTIGPGSYTGLRAGVSTVKGLAFAANKPIVPVNTLYTLAFNFPYCTFPILTTISAKRNELHCAMYKWTGLTQGAQAVQEVQEDIIETRAKGLYKVEEIKDIIHEKTIIAGDAVLLYSKSIKDTLYEKGDYGIFPRQYLHTISIASIASAALSVINKIGVDSLQHASTIVPKYNVYD